MIIDWKEIASGIYEDIKQKVEKLEKKPTLWAILVWNNSSSLRYIKQKQKWAQYTWIKFNLVSLDENIKEDKLLEIINNFNSDENISWYIIQLPLPKHINTNKIINSIDPKKDVDWFHTENQWKVLIWDDSWFIPCTPAWIIEILNSMGVNLEWKIVTIIWRSNIVWKPITALLMNVWATVINCNSKTPSIKDFTLKSDIIILAAWSPWLLNNDMVKKDSIIIDVGFTIINDKIYWDANFEEINNTWHKITPVPGWVWALTVAMLMKNTLRASGK